MDKAYIWRKKSLQPSPPLALCKKAAGCQGLRSNRQRRLDLDRLTSFCYFSLWRGLRWTKPPWQDLHARLPPYGGTRRLWRRIACDIARFAALAATFARQARKPPTPRRKPRLKLNARLPPHGGTRRLWRRIACDIARFAALAATFARQARKTPTPRSKPR